MSYNVTADLWYQYFNANGAQWLILLGVYGFRALWATLGIFFDFGIVYITVKSKSLRSICNILIAMESAFALILNIGYYASFLIVLSGIKFIRYEYCFWYVIVPCLFGDVAQMTMVFTGVDRLCAVAFPFWYQQRKIRKYLFFVVAIIILFGISDFVLLYIDYKQIEDIMISCSPNEIGQSFLAPVKKISGLTFSAIIMVVYSFCWFFVFKFTKTSEKVSENNRKLIKSLLLIICLNLIGVFIKCAVELILNNFVVIDVFIHAPFSIAFSFLTITVYSANAPVLYIVSFEYRTRFDQHFQWFPKLIAKILRTTTVAPISTSFAKPWIIVNNGTGAQ